ncbi:hypothetical protein [Listeria booriae]|uniref:Capsular biosynthesis protein n=1 Tax=Listeria booriae TaxID=1552123 RepID=A0A099WD42_9LIST|nr:hypothetical protein [Listeria booriae]KGL43699.1 hypothetical protein EP57_02170 [Listeria booriae]MBC1228015.1 hypothetical protein [Listeria booriae]MBC1285423.1 hypothetical protein [Listeria booriae]MBC1308669.1 hypothetical protein [Listeria booriae]MBC1331703.1 hypothetical protein [Listeria booriae]
MTSLSKKRLIEFSGVAIIALLSLFSFIFISLHDREPGYELLPLLPLLYLFAASFVYVRSLVYDFKMFNLVFIALSFMRYVVLPFFIVYAGYYGGRSPVPPTAHSYNLALQLMLYELVIVTIAIAIFDAIRKKRKKQHPLSEKSLTRSPSTFFYVLFAIVAILGVVIMPGALNSVSFLVPSDRVVGVLQTLSLPSYFALYMFMIAKQLVALLLIWLCFEKYKSQGQVYYVYAAIAVMVLNISIFAGTNRTDIILCTITSLFVFKKLFPDHFKKAAILIVSIVTFVVVLIASVRQIVSVSGDLSQLVDFTDTMQVYLGGPYNVAMAIEMKNMFPEAGHLSVLFYDIFRPMIGVNIFIKDLPIDFSVLYFNERYFFKDNVSQILPMIGQGNLYFGYLFAPLLSVSFVALAYFFQAQMERVGNIELVYFLTISTARIGFLMGQNTMNLVNDISYNLVLFLIIYFLNQKIIYKRRQRSTIL